MCEQPNLGNALFISGDMGTSEHPLGPGLQGRALTLGSGFQHRDLQSGVVSPVYPITPSFLSGKQRTPAGFQESSPSKAARINQSPR